MQRLISWIIRIAFVVVLLGASSYAGAQFKARQLVGPRAPVREPVTTLAWKGVRDVRGNPRAWVVTYSQSRLPGVQRVRVVVSLTGRVLAVTPPDLVDRLEDYRRSLEP